MEGPEHQEGRGLRSRASGGRQPASRVLGSDSLHPHSPLGGTLTALITDEELEEWRANRPSQGRVACGGEARLPSPGPLAAEPPLFTPGLGLRRGWGGAAVEGSGHGSFEFHRLWPCPDDLCRALKALGQEMLSGGFYEVGWETRHGEQAAVIPPETRGRASTGHTKPDRPGRWDPG